MVITPNQGKKNVWTSYESDTHTLGLTTTTTFDNIGTTTVIDIPLTIYIDNAYTNDYNNLQNVGLTTLYTVNDNNIPKYNPKITVTKIDNNPIITEISTIKYAGNIGTTVSDIPTTFW